MKLALVLGKQQGITIVQRLKGIKDNLNIDVFDSVPEFIDSSLKRNSIYDRILVLSTKINNTTLNDLYNYWSKVNKETNVVLLCKSGVDESKAQEFLDVFKTPVVAAMLVSTTTVQIIAEAVLRPTAELTSDYGIKDFLSVEVDEDVYETPNTSEKVEQNISNSEQNNQPNNQLVKSNVEQKQEKRSIFSSLFGKKKSKDKNTQVKDEQVTENLQEQTIETEDNSEENNVCISDKDDISASTDNYDEDMNEFSTEGTEIEESSEQHEFDDFTNSDDSFDTDFEVIPQNDIHSFGENTNINHSISSFNVDKNFDSTLEDVLQVKNDFEPETYNVDEDFSDEGVIEERDTGVRVNLGETTTIDENFGDLSLGSDEESYRQTAEAPKVIVQTVTKEVIRNVNTGTKLTTLNGVYSGRLKKIIIVTGDRGTGITSTALNIAKTLSQKVDVLYFDCDIENHGLLSYIDYSNFQNYENIHMNSIKLCKSSQAFNRCVISWDTSLYLLTTDYTCDATVDDLRVAGEIVAERADDFGVIVVDCPVDKLEYIPDLILTGQGVICVEGTKRGFMNMLCQFERSNLQLRFKRTLVSRGNLFVTKCNKHLDLSKLVSFIKAIYEPDEVNWLAPRPIAFDGKLSDKLLNDILEG